MAYDDAHDAATSSSADGDEDDEGTNTDASC
jgi:hypothetical protein